MLQHCVMFPINYQLLFVCQFVGLFLGDIAVSILLEFAIKKHERCESRQ